MVLEFLESQNSRKKSQDLEINIDTMIGGMTVLHNSVGELL